MGKKSLEKIKNVIRDVVMDEYKYDTFYIRGAYCQRNASKTIKSGQFTFRVYVSPYGTSSVFTVNVHSNRKMNRGWKSHVPINKIAKTLNASGFIPNK